jgi:hypothetical protein
MRNWARLGQGISSTRNRPVDLGVRLRHSRIRPYDFHRVKATFLPQVSYGTAVIRGNAGNSAQIGGILRQRCHKASVHKRAGMGPGLRGSAEPGFTFLLPGARDQVTERIEGLFSNLRRSYEERRVIKRDQTLAQS